MIKIKVHLSNINVHFYAFLSELNIPEYLGQEIILIILTVHN